jgi:hypothetical protein
LSDNWLSYWRLMTNTAYVRLYTEHLDSILAFRNAQISASLISSDSFNELQTTTIELLDKRNALRQPWLPTKDESRLTDYEAFRETWKELVHFDPEDEDALAEWSQKVENVLSDQNTPNQGEDEQAAIARRAAELRARRRAQRGQR